MTRARDLGIIVGVPCENASGDGFLAFSTANRGTLPSDAPDGEPPRTFTVDVLADAYIDPLFVAAIEATEEAIVNSLWPPRR